jgi:hypothetical protein
VRLRRLPKLGEMGPVRLYPERFTAVTERTEFMSLLQVTQ